LNYYSIIIGIAAILVIMSIWVALKIRLKKKSDLLDNAFKQTTQIVLVEQEKQTISERQDKHANIKDELIKKSQRPFEDIQSVLEYSFQNRIITSTEEKNFSDYFRDTYFEARNLKDVLIFFGIKLSEGLMKLIADFERIHSLVQTHNQKVISMLLQQNKDFFDHCLNYPLDNQQRRSIVSEEENCLVVSSAGSGKTSSIVGKVKYLIERKAIEPEKILLISYTNKAAAELTERMGVKGMRGYTFHKLALDLIGNVTGNKPSICENKDSLFVRIYHELLDDEQFREAIVEYFTDYEVHEEDWEKNKNIRRQFLSEQKNMRLKALIPDMDGNTITVRSKQEQNICFALSSLGVKFRYEEPYEYKVSDEKHTQYKPDFSIYYEIDGQQRRIYLEHYGVDEHGLVPVWFAKDCGISYEEANQRYGDGISWKKKTHEKFNTTLITTSSADFKFYDIREKLKTMLNQVGVPIKEKSEEELYKMILPHNSKKEKAFIRLIVTFVTLLKSSCKTIEQVLGSETDRRSLFIIQRIFLPVYQRYVKAMNDNGQIDFTDAILWATKLCEEFPVVAYDYIIVDEFQDISVDRYNFLKALRKGNPPAKLYCVGDDWQSIYRFSGSDMALFNHFADFFGPTEINKIETTYRFGEPLVNLSSCFIQRNGAQIKKDIHPFNPLAKTILNFYPYERSHYCETISQLVASIPNDKSIFLLGRYSFDDYYLSFMFQSQHERERFFYIINGRKIEFMTVHKSKGLEADYVIILQCNKDFYGFPSQVSDDPVLDCVLTQSDKFPFGEERRLFYVAITRAKVMTMVLFDQRFPSVFVNEFLHPEELTERDYIRHPNANKKWNRGEDKLLLTMYYEGKNIRYIADKMGRSQTSIIMRLGKLGVG